MREFTRQDRLIWIDHHKSAIDKYDNAQGPKLQGYRVDGVAACRLAWQWFATWKANGKGERGPWHEALPIKERFVNREVSEPLAVRLAGEYDIWDKRDPRAEIFQFGLRSRPLNDFDWTQILSTTRLSLDELESLTAAGLTNLLEPDGTTVPAIVAGLLNDGKLLQRYQRETDASVVNHRSFVVEWEGLKFLALTTARCNSLTFDSKDIPETGHDALMAFYYTGDGWIFSLYHAKHRKDLDLSAIAVKHGGGGHRGACGFRTECLPFLRVVKG